MDLPAYAWIGMLTVPELPAIEAAKMSGKWNRQNGPTHNMSETQ
jgi:hypothetical protein